ncbi:GIY-YIG nuclease family protein [Schumannella sp. 10F1B-5-1]|uniref:GIY-YIG nuclease family protein n=1 Tax=Schumannella sp. 10F1B-5-1 TaxID=2590780 RepID=UPI0011310B20|nr:GIY-YIG nuclease family protein [Schumannella sp. 10F1B-5-1]TPW73747.1 GIY-YIG nuclease family protein [Schumannella sp. 10F1B-5-1]
MPTCCAPGCDAAADEIAAAGPVPLCAPHLAIVGDVATAGVDDVLPSPCRACGSRLGVRYPSGWLCAVCEWRHGEFPDDEAVDARVDVVYYLRVADRIKIGTSSRLGQRMRQLWHDELIGIERGDRHRERARHEQFAATRFGRTEWFARSPELDAHLVAVTAGVSDPWELYSRWRSEAIALRG